MLEDTLIQCFSLLPKPTELSMIILTQRGHTFTNRVVSLLTTSRELKGVPCLLPKLEVLRLDGCLECSDKVLADMIVSRWYLGGGTNEQPQRTARLKVVDIKLNHALDTEAAACLEICWEQGLDFTRWQSLLEGPGNDQAWQHR